MLDASQRKVNESYAGTTVCTFNALLVKLVNTSDLSSDAFACRFESDTGYHFNIGGLMKITQEQFEAIEDWLEIIIPADNWPNPRALKSERTFYVQAKVNGFAADRVVLSKAEFDRALLYGKQTTT